MNAAVETVDVNEPNDHRGIQKLARFQWPGSLILHEMLTHTSSQGQDPRVKQDVANTPI